MTYPHNPRLVASVKNGLDVAAGFTLVWVVVAYVGLCWLWKIIVYSLTPKK